jgi:hypothetical protein
MPFSITPVPFEWFPEGARTRPLSFRADAIPAVLLLDFKLLRKSGSVLPRSRESLDRRMTAASRLRISGSALMLSESDKDNEALDRNRLDRSGKGHTRMDSDAFCDPSKSARSVVVRFLVDAYRRKPLDERFEARIISQRIP